MLKLANHSDSSNTNHAEKLTRMVMRLFEHWRLTYEEQAQVLGLSPKTHSTISRYKKGLSSIRLERDSYDRVRLLLSIHKLLRKIFPLNSVTDIFVAIQLIIYDYSCIVNLIIYYFVLLKFLKQALTLRQDINHSFTWIIKYFDLTVVI